MNVHFFRYRLDDGKILSSGMCPKDMLKHQRLLPGEAIVTRNHRQRAQDCYVDGKGNIRKKQHFTLDSIPLPAVIEIEGERYEVTEQPEFSFDMPGNYEIIIDAGPAYYVETFEYAYSPQDTVSD